MKTLLLALLVVCLTAVGASALVYTVPSPGIVGIGQALSLANAGDEVNVLPGVYYEFNLVLPPQVTLRGLGDAEHPVVIDAMGLGRILSSTGSVVTARIENLVLRNGVAPRGGGLLLDNTSLVVEGVRIEDCEGWYGGGLHVRGFSASRFERCDFVGNVSQTNGGGALVLGWGALTFIDCLFADNGALVAGGGFCVSGPQTIELERCTIAGNTAPHGAGLSGWNSGVFTGHNCLIAANQGRDYMGDTSSTPHFACTDIALHVDGDWSGGLVHQTDIDGNFSADPLFCGPVSVEDPWAIDAASPCAPENLPGCGQIGARYIGCSSGTGVVPDVPDPEAVLPTVTKLYPCRPNPFNPATTVSFDLHLPGTAVLEVFDTRGHLVTVLHRGDLGVGTHEFSWRGRDESGRAVPTGVYFARLVTATYRETRRMALIK